VVCGGFGRAVVLYKHKEAMKPLAVVLAPEGDGGLGPFEPVKPKLSIKYACPSLL
jgi:hypothetical protein